MVPPPKGQAGVLKHKQERQLFTMVFLEDPSAPFIPSSQRTVRQFNLRTLHESSSPLLPPAQSMLLSTNCLKA